MPPESLKNHCIVCGKRIPEGMNKCFNCATRKKVNPDSVAHTDPLSEEQYIKLEFEGVYGTDTREWTPEHWVGHLRNHIELALITHDVAWGGHLLKLLDYYQKMTEDK